jgi:hypothetical protein
MKAPHEGGATLRFSPLILLLATFIAFAIPRASTANAEIEGVQVFSATCSDPTTNATVIENGRLEIDSTGYAVVLDDLFQRHDVAGFGLSRETIVAIDGVAPLTFSEEFGTPLGDLAFDQYYLCFVEHIETQSFQIDGYWAQELRLGGDFIGMSAELEASSQGLAFIPIW